jgi:DNA-binding response OmpR family regulator
MTRILVIEDAASLRSDIVEMLGFEGYEVQGAENGRAGVEAARQFHPDLIISDIMMPLLDGYGVLAELREDPQTATIPFIFLTARTDRMDVRQGMTLGADDYVTKPFTIAELMSAVRARLHKHAAIERSMARRMDNLRGSIILALPHEMRTPLNVILGFSELMLTEGSEITAAQTQEMAGHINSAARRLYHLIENYLTYAQTEIVLSDPQACAAYKAGVALYPGEAIRLCADEVAARHHRAGDLSVDLEAVSGIDLSEDSACKIVHELIDNAFKFSEPGTPVLLTGCREDENYHLVISDHGRGMTRQQIDEIGAYNQFERAQLEDQGSGLGLVIALRLVELAHGHTRLTSTHGEGTEVHVWLPVHPG